MFKFPDEKDKVRSCQDYLSYGSQFNRLRGDTGSVRHHDFPLRRVKRELSWVGCRALQSAVSHDSLFRMDGSGTITCWSMTPYGLINAPRLLVLQHAHKHRIDSVNQTIVIEKPAAFLLPWIVNWVFLFLSTCTNAQWDQDLAPTGAVRRPIHQNRGWFWGPGSLLSAVQHSSLITRLLHSVSFFSVSCTLHKLHMEASTTCKINPRQSHPQEALFNTFKKWKEQDINEELLFCPRFICSCQPLLYKPYAANRKQ